VLKYWGAVILVWSHYIYTLMILDVLANSGVFSSSGLPNKHSQTNCTAGLHMIAPSSCPLLEA
jgi:hypothetical protein